MSSKINFEEVGGSHTVVTHSFDHCSLTAMQNKQGETMNKKKKRKQRQSSLFAFVLLSSGNQ